MEVRTAKRGRSKQPSDTTLRINLADLELRGFLLHRCGSASPEELHDIVAELGRQLGPRTETGDLRSVGSEDALAVHTEGVYTQHPLRYFLLACVQPSTSGGETNLYDARLAADLILDEAPDLAATEIEYRSGSHREGAQHRLIEHRSLRTGARSVLVFREDGYTNEILSLPDGWSDADFYSFMAEILGKSLVLEHSWSTGDVLAVDNYVTLHNRAPFRGPRWMIRARISG